MTPQSRHTAYTGISGKYGAPGAIRTPDPQIRSLNILQYFTYIIQWLALKHPQKSFEVFSCFPMMCKKVCHNYAIEEAI